MSDFHAIGGVSTTLQLLLKDRMEIPEGVTSDNFKVTVGTPWSEQNNRPQSEGPRINLFLYKVTENGYLKNQEITGHGHPSEYGHPPLSLDLHYLITPYGSTQDGDFVDERQAQFLLGSAMRVLHEHPVIDERLRTKGVDAGSQILSESLRGEFEKVKFYLEPLTLEDLSKVWTALMLPFRLSCAYMVSVVQIESRKSKRMALPVLDLSRDESPRVHIVPFKQPQISAIEPVIAGVGDILTVRGVNLGGADQVIIDNLKVPVTPLPDGSIEVAVPYDTFPDGSSIPVKERLRAGPKTVQVATEVSTFPRYLCSNLAVFMLVPNIIDVNPTSGSAGDTITVTFTPDFKRGDKAYLLIGDIGLEARPLESLVERSDSLIFRLPTAPEEKIRAGTYPLRLRINGGESRYEYTLVNGEPVSSQRFQVI